MATPRWYPAPGLSAPDGLPSIACSSPPGAVGEAELARSWNRCRDEYGLEQGAYAPAQVLTQAEARSARAAVDEILAEARQELDGLHAVVSKLGYATVLANADAVIVDRRCRDSDARPFQDYGTRPGALWSEMAQGTNGIGSCLVEQRAMNVHRDQHFHAHHANLSCSGAPIFDAGGHLSAVLNVASFATAISDRSHLLALALVTATTRAIEERLFRIRFRKQWVLALEPEDRTAPAILLAVDRHQAVLGADRSARAAFLLDDRQLSGQTALWQLFGRHPAVIRNVPGTDDLPVRMTRGDRAQTWRGWVTPPERISRSGARGLASGFHTRPRLDTIDHVEPADLRERPLGGLATGVRRRVLTFIDDHLGETLPVDLLAREAGLSRYHFTRAFKQSLGRTPHAYLLERRVEEAQSLLAGSDRPLGEIALAVGFSDQSHLSRQFLRHTGMTPGAWRRERRG